jgi:hypothetical protein
MIVFIADSLLGLLVSFCDDPAVTQAESIFKHFRCRLFLPPIALSTHARGRIGFYREICFMTY